MATHNPTKLLSLTSQTKLTLTLTLTLNAQTKLIVGLTLLKPNICAHIVDTHKTVLRIYKRNFLPEVGQIIALPAEIQRWLIQRYSAYASDNKLIIYRFKRGFFRGVCIEKWARSFVAGHIIDRNEEIIDVSVAEKYRNRLNVSVASSKTYRLVRSARPFLHSSHFYQTTKIVGFTLLFNRPENQKSNPSSVCIYY